MVESSDVKVLNKKCPMCKKKAVHQFRPFCSKACKNEDLNNWLGGKYVIAQTSDEDPDAHLSLSLDDE